MLKINKKRIFIRGIISLIVITVISVPIIGRIAQSHFVSADYSDEHDDGEDDVTPIQNLFNSYCTTTATTYKDIRDNEMYIVQRLADGECWMLDNLRLDLNQVTLEQLQGTTNASNTTLSYLKNGGGEEAGKYASLGSSSNWTTGPSYTRPLFNSDYGKTGTTSFGAGSGIIGTYYNYCAASAGSYCYSGATSGNATEDLCPAGWHLSSQAEIENLYEEGYSSNAKNFMYALAAPLSGYTNNGTSALGHGDYGYYWTSTRKDDASMYQLHVQVTGGTFTTNPASYGGRTEGLTIRCVKNAPIVYTVTLNNNGGTGGSTSATIIQGDKKLSTITQPTKETETINDYSVSGFTKDSSATDAEVSSTSTLYTTKTYAYTFAGWKETSSQSSSTIASNATEPVLQANTSYTNSKGEWISASNDITLYAYYTAETSQQSSVTLPTITKTGYTCKWQDKTNTSTYYDSGAQMTPSSNTELQGVCTANQYTITLNGNGANNTPTASTTVYYDGTTLGSIATLPTKSDTTDTRTISGFDKTASATDATISSTSTLNSISTTTYTFNGWHETTNQSSALIASNTTTPVLQSNTSYTNSNGAWTNTSNNITLYAGYDANKGEYSQVTLPNITKTGHICKWQDKANTSTYYNSGAQIIPDSSIELQGVCTANQYTITLDTTGANNTPTTSTTVTYGSTTLDSIATLPTKSNSTDTVNISGFTTTSSATNADISSTATLSSSRTTTYTFNGWHESSSQSSKLVASDNTVPMLQANTNYTNANGEWTSTRTNVTLYAGYTATTNGYSPVTLPIITKTGYTCKWQDKANTSTYYDSGAQMTPSSNIELQGVCTAKPDEPVTPDTNKDYTFSEGTVSLNDNGDLIIKTSGPVGKFSKLLLNGEPLEKDVDFTIASDPETGGSIITLKHDLVAGLENGQYDITAEYEDGISKATITKNDDEFTIKNVETKEDIVVPNTSGTPDTGIATNNNEGIISNASLIIIATILLGSGIAFIIHRNSKKVSFTKH